MIGHVTGVKYVVCVPDGCADEPLEELGVHQFAGYLQHDDLDGTLRAYGESVIPAFRDVTATTGP